MTLYFTLSALLTFLMVTLHTDTYSAIDEVLRDLGSPRIGWIINTVLWYSPSHTES